jgi:hypothetical protein
MKIFDGEWKIISMDGEEKEKDKRISSSRQYFSS